MSTGMLGRLPLSAVRGPKDDLDNLLAGNDGESVLTEFKKFVKRQPCWMASTKPTANPPTLVLVKTIVGLEAAGKNTRDCLTNKKLWAYKDPDINKWLLGQQVVQTAGSSGVYLLQKSEGITFREMALEALMISTGTRNDKLAQLLKERGMTYTLPAIEALVERQEAGEDVGLLTNGYANFAFVEGADDSVSVLDFSRCYGGWRGYVSRLDNGRRWDAERRLLLRNSDASAL